MAVIEALDEALTLDPYPGHEILKFCPDCIENAAQEFLSDENDNICGITSADWKANFSPTERVTALRAALLCHSVTKSTTIPRMFQLQAASLLEEGYNTQVRAGTGYGKTLAMVLTILLHPNDLHLVVSPLKRLQLAQVDEFKRFGISAIAINEDTSDDELLWKNISKSMYSTFVLSPEQLSRIDGKITKFGALLLKDRALTAKFRRFMVDEGHEIALKGAVRYGLPAFRPAYGLLSNFRRLSLDFETHTVPVLALSGTFPPHMQKTISKTLNYSSDSTRFIELSCNRSNIIYATLAIQGSRSDFRNLEFLIPLDGSLPTQKTLIFHEDSMEAVSASRYLARKLPRSTWSKGIVRYYHAQMSPEYLSAVFEDFKSPTGICKILCSTEIFTMGFDIRDIFSVILYGIPANMCTAIQRAGRVWRQLLGYGVVVYMYEAFMMSMDLGDDPYNGQTCKDPDKPLERFLPLTKGSSKQQRTSLASYHLIQDMTCIRAFKATYLGDRTPEALDVTTPGDVCCPRHNDGFKLGRYFLGAFLIRVAHPTKKTGTLKFESPAGVLTDAMPAKPPQASLKTRITAERGPLEIKLHEWRVITHSTLRNRGAFPIDFLLRPTAILELAKAKKSRMRTVADVMDTMEMAGGVREGWKENYAEAVLKVITDFDEQLCTRKRKKSGSTSMKGTQKKARTDAQIV